MRFDRAYDLIWIGSLFTHTSIEITRKWIAHLADQLSANGIIVASFHGRWGTQQYRQTAYIDEKRWAKIVEAYEADGYGYQDYAREQSHDFISGSYGISLAKPHAIVRLLEKIPKTRIFMYQERAWDGHHDVVAFGRPDWNDSTL